MKRKTINIIITIIISVVITCTLSLPALAEESTEPVYKYFGFDSVETTFNNTRIHSGLSTNDYLEQYKSLTLCSGEGFDQYIHTDFIGSRGSYSFFENKLVSNGFNNLKDKRDINYIGLDCAVFCDYNYNLNNLNFEPFDMIINGKKTSGFFTASIVSTVTTTQQVPVGDLPHSTTYTFKRLKTKNLKKK